jgi:MipA family protein
MVARYLATSLLLLLAHTGALAAPPSNWRLGVALGYGERANPLIQSDDVPIVVDLDIAYFGKHWFFDNGDIGWVAVDNDRMTANVFARVNSDRVFFGKTNTRFVGISAAGVPLSADVEVEPPDRDYAIEAGIELLFDGRWGRLQIAATQDVSGTHDGQQAFAEYGYGFTRGRWRIAPNVGLRYKSAALNDYYWGVRADEANIALRQYSAGAGVNVYGDLQASYYLSRRMRIALALNYERLDAAIRSSPILERGAVFGYFAGLSYRF